MAQKYFEVFLFVGLFVCLIISVALLYEKG